MKDQRDLRKHPMARGCMRAVLAVVLAVVFTIAGSPAMAKHNDSGKDEDSHACQKTSKAALTACKNSATSDYWLAVGACDNISDRQERKSCLDDARSSQKEDLQTCSDQFDARQEVCQELGGGPYDPDIDPANFSSDITNDFFPLPPAGGNTLTYKSTAPNGDIQTNVVTVKGTTTINGFACRAVTDKAYKGTDTSTSGILLEDTIDWFSQDTDGNVWYFGETTIAYTYDDAGNPSASTEGSWMAGKDNAKPGIIMLANPGGQLGKLYRQEFSLGTAEDLGRVIDIVDGVQAGGKAYNGCVHTQDSSPLEPGVIEDKYYAPGVGLVLTLDPDGTREELISITTTP